MGVFVNYWVYEDYYNFSRVVTISKSKLTKSEHFMIILSTFKINLMFDLNKSKTSFKKNFWVQITTNLVCSANPSRLQLLFVYVVESPIA